MSAQESPQVWSDSATGSRPAHGEGRSGPSARQVDRSGEPVFQLRSVSHSYGRNQVIFDVDLNVWPGEVVGLVGDNGAGKSTLLKIFAGYQKPSSGSVHYLGRKVQFNSTADARALGIEAVYQDLAIIDDLSLWRNFFLGKELVSGVGPVSFLRQAKMRQLCESALAELGLTRIRSGDDLANALSGGERQSVAITRAIHFGARVLLLDEPTAALSVRETRNVLASIHKAADHGLGILYIDHNMAHVLPVADRIVVLQLGRIVQDIDASQVGLEELQDIVAARHDMRPR